MKKIENKIYFYDKISYKKYVHSKTKNFLFTFNFSRIFYRSLLQLVGQISLNSHLVLQVSRQHSQIFDKSIPTKLSIKDPN